MLRTHTLAVMLLLLALTVLSGCGQNGAAATDAIVIAQGVDATTLDPHMHAETTTSNVVNQIFDRLLTRDAAMVLQPDLALSVTPLNDLTWEVKLREGVKFHNGEDFDAESVKFSIERIIDPATKSPQLPSLSAIDRVEIIDPHTVHIITKTPYPVLPGRLTLAMVPPRYIREQGEQYFAEHPVGTGPYTFVSWTKDEAIVLAANDAYWRGSPAIKQVTFRPIPENATRLAELQTGAVDLIVNVPPHQAADLDAGADTKVVKTPSGRFIFLQLAADSDGPLADPRVRQALNCAIDVPGIIDSILAGNGYRSTQPLTSLDFGFNPDLAGYAYNPERARQLLAEAGYPDGLTLDLDVPNGRYVMDKEVAQAVAGQLAAVGVDVNLNVNEWGMHISKILEHKMTGAFLIGWGTTLFDADATLFPLFRSGQRNSYYGDPETDCLLDAGRATLDSAARADLYHAAAAQLVENAAAVFLYQQEDVYGIDRQLNWQPRPDELIFVYDMSFGE